MSFAVQIAACIVIMLAGVWATMQSTASLTYSKGRERLGMALILVGLFAMVATAMQMV